MLLLLLVDIHLWCCYSAVAFGLSVGCYFVVVTLSLSSFLLSFFIHSFFSFSISICFGLLAHWIWDSPKWKKRFVVFVCLFICLFIAVCVFVYNFAFDKLNCKWNYGTHTHIRGEREREKQMTRHSVDNKKHCVAHDSCIWIDIENSDRLLSISGLGSFWW